MNVRETMQKRLAAKVRVARIDGIWADYVHPTDALDALTPPVEALVTALVEIHDYALKNLPRTKPGDIMANDICAKANAALAPFREGS